jgi:hypothetical protein
MMTNHINFSQFCSAVRRRGALALCMALCTLGLSGSARAQSFTIFDAPGAGTSPFEGTISLDINSAGEITGHYIDASHVRHGFLRAPDGTLTTFDAPGAGTGPGQGTFPATITPAGALTGYYIDAGNVHHGFLRRP